MDKNFYICNCCEEITYDRDMLLVDVGDTHVPYGDRWVSLEDGLQVVCPVCESEDVDEYRLPADEDERLDEVWSWKAEGEYQFLWEKPENV